MGKARDVAISSKLLSPKAMNIIMLMAGILTCPFVEAFPFFNSDHVISTKLNPQRV